MAYGVAGWARFRVKRFQQRAMSAWCLRVIPPRFAPIEELELPRVIESICDETRGLVLVPGRPGRANPRPWRDDRPD